MKVLQNWCKIHSKLPNWRNCCNKDSNSFASWVSSWWEWTDSAWKMADNWTSASNACNWCLDRQDWMSWNSMLRNDKVNYFCKNILNKTWKTSKKKPISQNYKLKSMISNKSSYDWASCSNSKIKNQKFLAFNLPTASKPIKLFNKLWKRNKTKKERNWFNKPYSFKEPIINWD
jgi:hypothetical protein